MSMPSIKTTAEALAMIEQLKAFIKEDSYKITQIVPFELYDFCGEYRMVIPTENSNKFSLAGLDNKINTSFSDDTKSLEEWLKRSTDRGWTKSKQKMSIIPSISIQNIIPKFVIPHTIVNTKANANSLIDELKAYVSTFDKVSNELTLEDIKAYEIFSYESSTTNIQSRMLVPVYANGMAWDTQFILTGSNGDIKLPFIGMGRKTQKEWLVFANEHNWKKTNTKFGIVMKD